MCRDANNVFNALSKNIAELMGDDLSVVIDAFIEKADVFKISKEDFIWVLFMCCSISYRVPFTGY